VLGRLVRAGHPPTVDTAMARFRAHVDAGEPLAPDHRALVFAAVARTNDVRAVADLKRILETVNFSEAFVYC
jgi:hypothetical protein